MDGDFSTITYFLDLLAIALILIGVVYLPVPALSKRIAFVLMGAYLLFFIAPRLALFYFIAWSLVFVLQRIVVRTAEQRWGLTLFWSAVVLLLIPMVVWKLAFDSFNVAFNLWGNTAVQLLGPKLWGIDVARDIVIPIGLSFATFRAIDLLVKTYLGQLPALSYDRVLFFGFFPPVQVIGPVIQYTEIGRQAEEFSRPQADDIYQGLFRVASGLLKVMVIAVALQPSSTVFIGFESANPVRLWGLLFVYTWYFYINFSGYSDLAIGVSRLFGFRLNENFNFPYFRKNIADYWNNWHMSLSHFAQRNAYVPLGGYRKNTQYIAILGTIMVIALWHNVTWGMVVFGLYHGAGLIAHRVWSNRFRAKRVNDMWYQAWPKIGITYLFVTLGFPLLILPLPAAIGFYSRLIGL